MKAHCFTLWPSIHTHISNKLMYAANASSWAISCLKLDFARWKSSNTDSKQECLKLFGEKKQFFFVVDDDDGRSGCFVVSLSRCFSFIQKRYTQYFQCLFCFICWCVVVVVMMVAVVVFCCCRFLVKEHMNHEHKHPNDHVALFMCSTIFYELSAAGFFGCWCCWFGSIVSMCKDMMKISMGG